MKGAHGIRGEVRIETFDPASVAIRPGVALVIGGGPGRAVDGARPHGTGWLVRLAGVESRSDAEALRGLEVAIDRAVLPPLGRGEFYLGDVIGYAALDVGGRALGEIDGVLDAGAQPLLRLRRPGGRSALVPCVEGIVREVRHDRREVVLCPPDGLLDL